MVEICVAPIYPSIRSIYPFNWYQSLVSYSGLTAKDNGWREREWNLTRGGRGSADNREHSNYFGWPQEFGVIHFISIQSILVGFLAPKKLPLRVPKHLPWLLPLQIYSLNLPPQRTNLMRKVRRVMETISVYQFVGIPSAECCSKRIFPTKVTRGFISNPQGIGLEADFFLLLF
jgi:hypothetical protein